MSFGTNTERLPVMLICGELTNKRGICTDGSNPTLTRVKVIPVPQGAEKVHHPWRFFRVACIEGCALIMQRLLACWLRWDRIYIHRTLHLTRVCCRLTPSLMQLHCLQISCGVLRSACSFCLAITVHASAYDC